MSKHNPPDSVVDQPGHFARPPGFDPILHEGHQPGKPVKPEDDVPEFHGKVLPAGSAPEDRTFAPNAGEVPTQAANDDMDEETQTSAMDTIGGATSVDVHKGLGHPGQGQTSTELRHDGQHGRGRQGQGLTGVPASSATATNTPADARTDQTQRALGGDEAWPGRGDKGTLAAEDIPPEQAK